MDQVWWRNSRGAMRKELINILIPFREYLGGWGNIIDLFGFDYCQIDCALEQFWAERNGLA